MRHSHVNILDPPGIKKQGKARKTNEKQRKASKSKQKQRKAGNKQTGGIGGPGEPAPNGNHVNILDPPGLKKQRKATKTNEKQKKATKSKQRKA